MDRIPYQILTSKNRRLEWSYGSPHNWSLRRIPGATSFHAEVKNKCRIILELIPSASGMCWIAHYSVQEDLSLFIKSEGDRFNLFLVLDGGFEYKSKAQAGAAAAWQLNIMKASALNHEMFLDKDKGLIVLNLFIQPQTIKAYQRTFPILTQWLLSSRETKDVTALRYNIDDDGRLKQILNPWWTKGLSTGAREIEMERFIFHAFDQLEMSLVAEKVASDGQLESLRKVRARLLTGLFDKQPPPLNELSQMVGMHFKMLERLFKANFGITMAQFFKEARMEAIYRRLCCSTKSFPEIAIEFGYEEYPSFSAAVKRRFEKTPRQIRQTAKTKGC